MTKKLKRRLCMLLTLVMVCVLLPLPGNAQAVSTQQPEEAQALAQRGVYEVTALREESVKHFALPDGTYQAVSYGEPIHELDENGPYKENCMYGTQWISNAWQFDLTLCDGCRAYLSNYFSVNEGE